MIYQLLIGAILVIGAIFLALTLGIIFNKAWRDFRNRRIRRRRREIEPKVMNFAHGIDAGLEQAVGGPLGRRDRRVVEQILLDQIPRVPEVEKIRLSGAMEQLGLVDEYLSRLRARSAWTRADAAERLGNSGAARAIDPLAARLEDDSSEVRLRAARALGQLGGRSAIRPLVLALSEPSRWSTIRIADILMTRGQEVIEELIRAFPGLSLHGRLAALDVLGGIGALEAAPWLRERLKDSVPDVRSRASSALGSIGDLEAGSSLIETLRDPEWPVRAMSAKSLGSIMHIEAIPALCNALRDPVWWVRTNSAEALQLMGPDGLDALKKMMDDPDTYARHQAVLILQESGFLDEIIGKILDPDPGRRSEAHLIVDRLIRDDQLGRLRELSQRHPDEQVRNALQELLPSKGIAQEMQR